MINSCVRVCVDPFSKLDRSRIYLPEGDFESEEEFTFSKISGVSRISWNKKG